VVAVEELAELQNAVFLGPAVADVKVVAGRIAGCEWRVDEPLAGVVVLGLVLELVLADRRVEFGVTVDSWSCISIMCSPSRIVRFKGAFPERKSFTWNIKQALKYAGRLCA
jgi:hypothetical protein